MSKLLWITVPGGIISCGEDDEAVLRVLIAPRLQGNSLTEDGMERWPPQDLVEATLVVDFTETVESEIHRVEVEPPHIRPQPGVWEAFFGPGTIVIPPRPRNDAAPYIEVDGTFDKAEAIEETFRSAASIEPRLNHDEYQSALRNELMKRWSAEGPRIPPPTSLSPPSCQPPDFHRTISMLREHPAVLRALGLIIELKIQVSKLPTRFTEGLVRVSWPDAPVFQPKVEAPWTQYDSRFLPGSTKNISAGMVTLTDDRGSASTAGDSRWKVVTVDVDNGVMRLQDAARVIAATPADSVKPAASSRPLMLPALRSAGLMLVRRGRKAEFDVRRQAAGANARRDSMSEVVLTADDLVLGYRIDIKPQGRDWFSLHERDAKYTVSRDGAEITIGEKEVREEGHVKAHAAIDDGSGKLHTDEVVVRWSGWSLSVPRPSFDSSAVHSRPAPHPCIPYKFDWTFTVPKGTLPRLRFAHTYRMRARVADIAGGGLDVRNPETERCFTEKVTYQRYEPVASPDLALPHGLKEKGLGPGESIEQVVIRSDIDGHVNEFKSNALRVLLAPLASLTLAEQHGALDKMPPDQIRELVKRTLENASQDTKSFADKALFPDFAAGGVCVFPRREPGDLNGNRTINQTERVWSEPWPEFKCKQIVLEERVADESNILDWEADSTGDPNIDDRLIVRLAKAEELTLELSSFLKADFLDHFAIRAALSPSSEHTANQGRHPMVTPDRTIIFTHAVRRPLNDPRGILKVRRKEEDTFAVLDPDPALLGVDPKSTGKLEIAATWTERSGNSTSEVVCAPVQAVIVNRGDQFLKDTIRHEFGDTRHRMVTYTLTAVSRFRQFFDVADDAGAFIARTVLSEPVSIPNSARPSPPIVISTRPALAWQENREDSSDFKLIRRRLGGYLRVELKSPWYETGEGEQLGVIVWKDGTPPKEMWPFLTQVGRDPARIASYPNRFPTSATFAGTGAPREVYLKEAREHVVVVPYEPWFHEDRWLVDIVLPGMSNWPFVQLAVARYQSDSLAELELSSVVKTEMVQLMPERTLSVRRSGNNLFVSFSGRTADRRNRFKVFLEEFRSAAGASADGVTLTALDPPTDGTPAWLPIADQTRIGLVQGRYGPDGSTEPYEFQLQIQSSHGPLRIRIQEFESTMTPKIVELSDGDDLSARTVYSDIVFLPKT
jgi:hypothetical protein